MSTTTTTSAPATSTAKSRKNILRKTSLTNHETKIVGLYDLEHTIGQGHFAVVKLARHVFTGEKVAVKIIDKTKLDPLSTAHMMQEVRCMKLVRHPNIVRLYEVIDTQTKLFLILELGDYDMYEFIMKRTAEKGVKEAEAQKYFSQIIKAIDYCHTLHVVHRDLKLENVVFFESLGMVKLTDFGFSNLFTPGQQLETSCGSLAYSAPEILLGDAYDAPAVDVWSLGVLLYMLVIGRLPFQETNDSETLTKILDCKYSIPDYVSPSCKQLISRMLVRDPEKRATLHEIVQSQWVISGDRGLAEALPLIVRDHLPDSAHTTIIEQMVAGGIGTEDDILGAIEEDEYNYMTATYYLLAERVLSSYREEQAQRLLCNGSHDIDDAMVSEASANGTAATATSSSAPVRSRSRSNSWRGPVSRRACTILKEESEEELSTYLRSSSRQSSRNSSPSVSMFHAGLTASRDRISPQAIHDLIDFTRLSSGMRRAASPDSRYSSRSPSPPNSSGRTSPAISGIVSRLKASSIVASSGGMRKLSSSPHLLGICEESEDGTDVTMPVFKGTGMVKQRSTSSAASTSNMRMNVRSTRSASTGIAAARLQKYSESSFDGLLPPQASRAPSNPNLAATYGTSRIVRPRQAVVSPDMLRRYDTQRFLHKTRRSTSCSSSETSEDEDRRLNLIIGSKYCKRDSDQDPKPDDDPPRGPNGNNERTVDGKPLLNSTNNSATNNTSPTAQNGSADAGNARKTNAYDPSLLDFAETGSIFSRVSSSLHPIMEHPACSMDDYDRTSLAKCQMFNRSETARDALFEWVQESKGYTLYSSANDRSNQRAVDYSPVYRRRRSTASDLGLDALPNSAPDTEPATLERSSLNRSSQDSESEPKFYRNLRRSRSLNIVPQESASVSSGLAGSPASMASSTSDSLMFDVSDKADLGVSFICSSGSLSDSGYSSEDDCDAFRRTKDNQQGSSELLAPADTSFACHIGPVIHDGSRSFNILTSH